MVPRALFFRSAPHRRACPPRQWSRRRRRADRRRKRLAGREATGQAPARAQSSKAPTPFPPPGRHLRLLPRVSLTSDSSELRSDGVPLYVETLHSSDMDGTFQLPPSTSASTIPRAFPVHSSAVTATHNAQQARGPETRHAPTRRGDENKAASTLRRTGADAAASSERAGEAAARARTRRGDERPAVGRTQAFDAASMASRCKPAKLLCVPAADTPPAQPNERRVELFSISSVRLFIVLPSRTTTLHCAPLRD